MFFRCQSWYSYTTLLICSTSWVHSFDPHKGLSKSPCSCLCSALKYVVPCPGALNGENPDTASHHMCRAGEGHLRSWTYRMLKNRFPTKTGGRKVVARNNVFPGLCQQRTATKFAISGSTQEVKIGCSHRPCLACSRLCFNSQPKPFLTVPLCCPHV